MATPHDQGQPGGQWPRVELRYGPEACEYGVGRELPFVVGVLGDYSGNAPTRPLPPPADRKFVDIDRATFDDLFRHLTPGLSLRVENTLVGDGSELAVRLPFTTMADFEPGRIVRQVPPLAALLEARDGLRDQPGRSADVEAIDAVMSKQLAAIMHHPDFQKLEGSWRGLNYLVTTNEAGPYLKIRVLNLSKGELSRALETVPAPEHSRLARMLQAYGPDVAGGEPFAVLVGDYGITNHPDDIAMLSRLSRVAACCFCPFVAAASPGLFGLGRWEGLYQVRDLEQIFESVEYAAWRSFRESEDSRYVALTLPRVLARPPYGDASRPVEGRGFQELELDGPDRSGRAPHDRLPWMNAAYLWAVNAARSFARYGLCTAICGRDGGGTVTGLPSYRYTTEDGEQGMSRPTEVALFAEWELSLTRLGFLPLCDCRDGCSAVFYGAQTCQKPKCYTGPQGAAATQNAAVSARLPFVLVTARFLHYLKVIGTELGGCQDRDDIEDRLNRWLAGYVNDVPDASPEGRARSPLRAGRVELREVPGRPEVCRALVYLWPWLGPDELSAPMRLVTTVSSGP